MKLFDIVIPSAGREEDLIWLLFSLQTYAQSSIAHIVDSITVSDDRYTLALAQKLRDKFPNVHYALGPGRGPAANRNNAASKGSAPWIVFLDDDCYLESDILDAYKQVLAVDPHLEVMEGAIGQHRSAPKW